MVKRTAGQQETASFGGGGKHVVVRSMLKRSERSGRELPRLRRDPNCQTERGNAGNSAAANLGIGTRTKPGAGTQPD